MNRQEAEDALRMARWARTTRSWFRKVAAAYSWKAEHAQDSELRWLLGYDAEQLLVAVLGEAELCVGVFDVDQSAEVERAALKLAGLLRRRRLSFALANTEGRTPEEAELFRVKAIELSGRVDG